MRRSIVLTAAALGALGVFASQASAHPITPPGRNGEVVTHAATAPKAQGHTKGLACADVVSEAIGQLAIPCTVAPLGQP